MIKPVLGPSGLLDDNTKYFINPTGRFVIGGPAGDTGLTGRKIIVDTYGGMGRHGAGLFRQGSFESGPVRGVHGAPHREECGCRGLADRCELELALRSVCRNRFPVLIDTFGTEKVEETAIEQAILKVFDLTPHGIVEALQLKNPIYRATAAYGHFGRDNFSWEKTDKVEALRKAIR